MNLISTLLILSVVFCLSCQTEKDPCKEFDQTLFIDGNAEIFNFNWPDSGVYQRQRHLDSLIIDTVVFSFKLDTLYNMSNGRSDCGDGPACPLLKERCVMEGRTSEEEIAQEFVQRRCYDSVFFEFTDGDLRNSVHVGGYIMSSTTRLELSNVQVRFHIDSGLTSIKRGKQYHLKRIL